MRDNPADASMKFAPALLLYRLIAESFLGSEQIAGETS
jgi:hypothetical protein